MLWFLIPVVDCLRLIGLRVIAGRSPFSSDSNHLHHILGRWMPWRWGLVAYFGLAGVPGLLALALPSLALVWIVLTLASYGIVVGVSGHKAAHGRVTSPRA